jgi:ABC-type Zn uptake system ZnuABC Zn-binding protein ZnuA
VYSSTPKGAWSCRSSSGCAVRRAFLALLLASCALVPHALAQQRLAVVATTTDLKSLVEAVGGDRVFATSMVPPGADAEAYQPRPQDLARLKDARMVVRVGLDYDLWLDRLLRQADNRALSRGGPGYVDASVAIAVLDVRGSAAGAQGGHAHGSGNPHYWLDPSNAEIITGTLLEAMARLDPANAKYYEARRIAFLDRLEARMRTWEAALAGIQGKPMIAYHNSWAYLARRFRLHVAGTIETKAGIPPSPAHLAALVRSMNEMGIRAILKQPFEPAKYADFLAGKTGARVIVLAASVGAVAEATDYLALFDYNVKALSGA